MIERENSQRMKVVVEKESTEAANETDGLGLLSASDKK